MDQKTMDDLLLVGSDKPIGYVPLSTIIECGYDPQSLAGELQAKGLSTYILSEEQTRVKVDGGVYSTIGGVLCAFHKAALEELLSLPQNQKILERAQWPKDVDGFARAVNTKIVPFATPLHDLIAEAFGHKKTKSSTVVQDY